MKLEGVRSVLKEKGIWLKIILHYSLGVSIMVLLQGDIFIGFLLGLFFIYLILPFINCIINEISFKDYFNDTRNLTVMLIAGSLLYITGITLDITKPFDVVEKVMLEVPLKPMENSMIAHHIELPNGQDEIESVVREYHKFLVHSTYVVENKTIITIEK